MRYDPTQERESTNDPNFCVVMLRQLNGNKPKQGFQ